MIIISEVLSMLCKWILIMLKDFVEALGHILLHLKGKSTSMLPLVTDFLSKSIYLQVISRLERCRF